MGKGVPVGSSYMYLVVGRLYNRTKAIGLGIYKDE